MSFIIMDLYSPTYSFQITVGGGGKELLQGICYSTQELSIVILSFFNQWIPKVQLVSQNSTHLFYEQEFSYSNSLGITVYSPFLIFIYVHNLYLFIIYYIYVDKWIDEYIYAYMCEFFYTLTVRTPYIITSVFFCC